MIFKMERMTVMLTPAYTLLSGVARCSEATLECQVYGTRICIDSLNACDGVPNCGAYGKNKRHLVRILIN